jgi:hypothetical protein
MGTIGEHKTRRAAEKSRQAKQQESPKKKVWWFRESLPIDRFTGWLMIYTGLLFVATLFSAGILYKTDITLNETLLANERPWIQVDIEPSGDMRFDADGLSLSIALKLRNIGKSPAIDAASRYSAEMTV